MRDYLQRFVYGGAGALLAVTIAEIVLGDPLPHGFKTYSRIVSLIFGAICLTSVYVEWRYRKDREERAHV